MTDGMGETGAAGSGSWMSGGVAAASHAGASTGWERPGIAAALDLGTNNCRMLIARPCHGAGRANGGFRVIDAFSRLVRLGQGVESTGLLCDEAMERALTALKVCAAKLDHRGVTRYRAVATEACRRARNGGEFLARAHRETGLTIERVAPDEEAALALAGCAPLLDPVFPYALVFDLGGGSTEIVWTRLVRQGGGIRPEVLSVISLPVGVVTLTERAGEAIASEQRGLSVYTGMVADVRRRLGAWAQMHGIPERIRAKDVQMIGSSGTVTTLAAVVHGLPRYDRGLIDGTTLYFEDVRTAAHRLAALGHDGRAAHPCIGSDRADLVVSGCAIVEAICDVFPVGMLKVGDRGVREGILFGLLGPER